VLDIDGDVVVQGVAVNKFSLGGGTSGSQISATKLNGVGNSGDIRIRARNVKILEGAVIESGFTTSDAAIPLNITQTAADVFQGKTGDIIIDAADSIVVSGTEPQPTELTNRLLRSSQIANTISIQGNGDVGRIQLRANSLQVTAGGSIQSDLLGKGQPGEIDIVTTGSITIAGIANTSLKNYGSAITSFADALSSGDSGKVSIKANSLNIEDGGFLSVNNRGIGNAGDLTIAVDGEILVSGVSLNGDISRISSSATSLTGERRLIFIETLNELGVDSTGITSEALGDGGFIYITANSLRINNRAEIVATTDGQGRAGDIEIRLRDRLIANNAEIKTTSEKSSGGNIDLTARAIVLRNDSNIKTNVASGSGQGGSIRLQADGIVLLDDSDLLAFARDGQGGNISLFTSALLTRTYKPSDPASNLETLDKNGFVDINATGRTSGIITLPELNPLQNNRTDLNPGLIDTNQAISRSCLTRNPKTGKFYITGTGGLPIQPIDLPISTYSTLPVSTNTTLAEADNLYKLPNGQIILAKTCPASP
jgi:hypothetical protein